MKTWAEACASAPSSVLPGASTVLVQRVVGGAAPDGCHSLKHLQAQRRSNLVSPNHVSITHMTCCCRWLPASSAAAASSAGIVMLFHPVSVAFNVTRADRVQLFGKKKRKVQKVHLGGCAAAPPHRRPFTHHSHLPSGSVGGGGLVFRLSSLRLPFWKPFIKPQTLGERAA